MNNSFIFQPNISNKNNVNQNKTIFSTYEFNENMKSNSLKNNKKSKFDLTFTIIENDNYYKISIEYNKELYDSIMIKRILDSYIEIMKNINNLENNDIRNIEYVPMEEKDKIIKEFNSDVNIEGCEKIYHEEFSKIAKEYPERIAIIFNEEKISYKKLDEMSNSLAHYLRSEGVKRNDIIPIICDRSPYYIIGILGISKAGGAFLPIDKDLPNERIQFILGEVNSKIILFSNCKEIINELKNNGKNIEYNMYDLIKHDYSNSCSNVSNINEPDDTCYVLFTSGTTGKPKGAMVSYFNIFNYVRNFNKNEKDNFSIYNLFIKSNNIKNVLGLSNFSFDISHIEITISLVNGLCIILLDDKGYNDITLLSNYIVKNNVQLINTTPSRFKLFIENELFRNSIRNVKAVILTGENLSKELCENIYQYSNTKIYNGYGPTECAVDCTFIEINKNIEKMITIGKPLCNCKLYILDKFKKPVPIGVEGEIYIGGYGVGKGYLNRPELTKERFVENPFNFDGDEHNRIMYRTGDLGRWTMEGEIEYLGRIDFQVKINGQRVELGEIESKVLEIPEIQQCIVIDKMKENEEKYLVCYYITGKEGNEISNKKINEIPLSSTGKLNRRGLPEPKKEDFITETYVPPMNNIEKVICKIYNDVFNIPGIKIGRIHDFYELGGNSFNAIKIIGKIRNILKINLTIKDIMKNNKIYLLSNMCNKIINQNELKYKIDLIENTHKDEFPINYLFNNIFYYIDQNDLLESDKISKDNIIIYYRILKDLNIEKLNYAFNLIINRHKILKAKFIEKIENGRQQIYGKIRDEMILNIEKFTKENYKTIKNKINTTKENLIRVGIIENKILVIKINHIICDGYSYGILINELINIYNDKILDELPCQFSDYAIYFDKKLKSEDAFMDQIQYYKSIFDCQFDIMRLPQKVSNESKKEFTMKVVTQMFSNEIYTNIKKLIKDENISETTYFLVVICLVLSIYSKQKNILTCVSSSSRNNYNTEKLIGMFVSKIPILVKFENMNMNLIDLIQKYKNILLTILSYDVPIKRLMEELNINSINMRIQYNPYDLFVNNENSSSKYLKNINYNEISTILGENNNTLLDKEKDNDTSKRCDKYNDRHEIDFDILVSELESSYSLEISYNDNLFEENLVQDIINDISLIIKNKNYLNKNINSIVDSIVNKPVNM
eukprot:jgi/Orpsp1_1/1183346/evm.model.c7180000084793.1